MEDVQYAHWIGRLVWHHIRPRRLWEEKISCPDGIRTIILWVSASSAVTIPTETSWLLLVIKQGYAWLHTWQVRQFNSYTIWRRSNSIFKQKGFPAVLPTVTKKKNKVTLGVHFEITSHSWCLKHSKLQTYHCIGLKEIINPFKPCDYIYKYLGYAVMQLVEALRFNSQGRGFDSRWGPWDFVIDLIVLVTLWPWDRLSL